MYLFGGICIYYLLGIYSPPTSKPLRSSLLVPHLSQVPCGPICPARLASRVRTASQTPPPFVAPCCHRQREPAGGCGVCPLPSIPRSRTPARPRAGVRPARGDALAPIQVPAARKPATVRDRSSARRCACRPVRPPFWPPRGARARRRGAGQAQRRGWIGLLRTADAARRICVVLLRSRL